MKARKKMRVWVLVNSKNEVLETESLCIYSTKREAAYYRRPWEEKVHRATLTIEGLG